MRVEQLRKSKAERGVEIEANRKRIRCGFEADSRRIEHR